MDRHLFKTFSVLGIALYLFIAGGELTYTRSNALAMGGKKDPSKILRKIYEEVSELGKFPGDDFILREFFVGPGKDDTYKDIHVLVLIQHVDGKEKMTVQVTYFRRSEKDPTVKYAENVRNISCLLEAKKLAITKSDYDEKELKKLLPEILTDIRGKKELLKKIERKKC